MRVAELLLPIPLYPFDRAFDYIVPDEMIGVDIGSLVKAPLSSRQSWGVVAALKEPDERKLKALSSLTLANVFSSERLALARWMSEEYFFPLGEVVESMLPTGVRKASEKLLAKIPKVGEQPSTKLRELNVDQQKAFRDILDSQQKTHLLWGVTGSGKTEVYLHLIDTVLREEKSAIMLVPEIALTPQLFGRFITAFPENVALFHSAQSDKEQRENWLAVYSGKKKIALGPRSALFAPVKNLGLIVIDEEHEGSYKQEERLRYHARDVAIRYADLTQAKLVLGSATPSFESFYRAREGIYALHSLPKRAVPTASMPTIELVDLKKNIAQKSFATEPQNQDTPKKVVETQGKGDFFFSAELLREIELVEKQKTQAILFLNRRGLGRALICRNCAHEPMCVRCAVTLVPHRGKLLCHYCGYERGIPEHCPSCNTGVLREIGIGTEAVEEELAIHFPQLRILRLDRDKTQNRDDLLSTLKTFTEKKADVLIGTQMVAKGHDFPEVSLVGIVMADVGFSLPDFRSEERIFQLLTQVSGRAGRAQHPGKVIVQTFRPDDPLFVDIQKGESLEAFEKFYERTILTRELLFYPPYARIAILLFQGENEAKTAEAAQVTATALKKIQAADFLVLGSAPAPLHKVRNRYRYHVLLKSKNTEVLMKALHWVQDKWITQKMEKAFDGTRLIVDVDPMQVL